MSNNLLASCQVSLQSLTRLSLRLQLLLFIAHFASAQITPAADLKFKMEAHSVVPDVISVAPTDVLEVVYENDVKVDMGNELKPTQVKSVPAKLSWPTDEDTFYTLVFTDPDAPSRTNPTFREWHHWLVVNIPGTNIQQGQTLSEYVGSGPPKKSGLHRYIYLIFKQPSKLQFDEQILNNRSAEGREKFSTQKFAAKYGLGNPIAGNFFQAQWDEYVPILYEQLGG